MASAESDRCLSNYRKAKKKKNVFTAFVIFSIEKKWMVCEIDIDRFATLGTQ